MNNICNSPPLGASQLVLGLNLFDVAYQDDSGAMVHVSVRKVTEEDYEVFVKEKGVIIHCLKDKNNGFYCKLNTYRNPPWVDQLCFELGKKLNEKGDYKNLKPGGTNNHRKNKRQSSSF